MPKRDPFNKHYSVDKSHRILKKCVKATLVAGLSTSLSVPYPGWSSCSAGLAMCGMNMDCFWTKENCSIEYLGWSWFSSVFTTFSYELSPSEYTKIIKWRICTRSPIPDFFGEQMDPRFSIQPKLITIASTLIVLPSCAYLYRAAKRCQRRYNIPQLQRNMMDIGDKIQVRKR